LCAWELTNISEVFVEDFSVEEEDCAEGLVLGRAGAPEPGGDKTEEVIDFGGAHEQGVFQLMIMDEVCNPLGIGFGSFRAHVSQLGCSADEVEEFWFLGRCRWRFHGRFSRYSALQSNYGFESSSWRRLGFSRCLRDFSVILLHTNGCFFEGSRGIITS
jgi:hypothetical protein